MPRKINFSEDSPDSVIDVFEAIKRARIRLGFIRQKPIVKKPEPKDPEPKKTEPESPPIITEKGPGDLVDAAVKAHDVLFTANTVFPFMLFPDTITIDREKLTIANRYFFRTAKIISVPIRDILSVEANIGPFFGSVHISSRFFASSPYSINYLSRSDTLQSQRLLQGYIIAHEQDIDCTMLDKEQLIILLNDLGHGDTD